MDFIQCAGFPSTHRLHRWENGLNAFLVMAVVLMGVEKAVAVPCSKREHLLNYWVAI
jgi:hypothetical protein